MLKLSQYFANSSVWALRFVGGNSLLRRLVLALPFVGGITPTDSLSKIREMRCFSRVFCRTLRGGAAAECTIFRKYNSHFSLIFAIICNSCFCKSRRCSPWCCGQMRCVDNGLEVEHWAFSIRCARCAARNDLAPEVDVSALLATVSLPVNVVPFPLLKLS